MFLGGFSVQYQTVSSNGEFLSILVWILIKKDNTNNKVFEREFY